MSRIAKTAGPQTLARRRVDFLQNELDHGRLTPMAYTAGRGIEDAIERAFRAAGPTWEERVDTSTSIDSTVVFSLEAARQTVRAMERVERVVGTMDARLLRRLLGDRLSIDEVASMEGRPGPRGCSYLLARVRDGLEELGRVGQAKGSDRRHERGTYPNAAQKYAAGVS